MHNSFITTVLLSTFMIASNSANASGEIPYAQANNKVDTSTHSKRVSTKIRNISVDGKRRESKSDVLDKALYKAAKKTLDKNYDWFRVISRDTTILETNNGANSGFTASYGHTPQRSCGLLGCSSQSRNSYRNDIISDYRHSKDTRYAVSIDYVMGSGHIEYEDGTYIASEAKKEYK